MSPRLFIFLVLAVAISTASAAIDFTPILKEYSAQGFTYREVKFKSGEGSVTLNPPQGWAINGGTGRLQLRPPNNNFVEGIIEAVPLQAARPFDQEAVQALQQRVMSETPPGSHLVQFVRSQENPVRMDQNPSFEFVISYESMGKTFQRSVIFVNCAGQQLIFRFTAPKKEFEAFNRDFLRSISTWQWIEPSKSTTVAQGDQPQTAGTRQ
jgi:hypothetical protein